MVSNLSSWALNGTLEDQASLSARGTLITVVVTYFRRKGTEKRAGKRNRGVYAGLVLLGICDRCMPGLASEISVLAALMGPLEEARKILDERGIALNIKTLPMIAYRYAQRARVAQQASSFALERGCNGTQGCYSRGWWSGSGKKEQKRSKDEKKPDPVSHKLA